MKPPRLPVFSDPNSTASEVPAVVPEHSDWPRLAEVWSARLPVPEPSGLANWQRLALLGVWVGFHERNLDPSRPEHQAVLPRVLKDVGGAFRQLRESGGNPDDPAVCWQVYDFGIQWAYYLDWELYMSQELY